MAHWQPSEKARIILLKWYPDVSKERLTLKDLRFVVKALKTLSPRWEDIGMTIDVIDLDKIKKEYRGTYKRLIAVINSWLLGNYHMERDGSNAPSWWKIVDVIADDIGGADPNLAKGIAQNWRELGKDKFSPLALTASNTPLSRRKNASWKLITEIAKAVQGVASKWFEIATLLGIPVDKLNSIKDDCDGTPACLTETIKEWLSGRYTEADGYPTPSVIVLVDVVEHQAGGADPSLARELAKITFQDSSTTNRSTNGAEGPSGEPTQSQVGQPLPATEDHDPARHARQQCHTSQASEQADGSQWLQQALHRNLAMKDLFEITQYLGDMDNEQLIKLGGALGLRHPSLKRMKTLPDDMVAAWLLRQEDVLERSGEPTYERLAVALEKVRQNGLARDVREQKHA